MSVPMTLSGHEGRDAKGQTVLDDLLNYAPTVSHRSIKFGRMPQVGEQRVSNGSDTPHIPREWGPASPKLFGTPLLTPIRFDLQRPNTAW